MGATVGLLVATHEDCRGHLTIPGHPERPARLQAAIDGSTLAGGRRLEVRVDEGRAVGAITRVHEPALVDRLREACRRATPGFFDCDDNPISEGTYAAAVAAVAAILAAADEVALGRADTVWCPVRPPGHHALRSRAMGFCFFNNVAVLAEELLARGIGPLAIVDFDVHHGNGTQEHFWRRNDVFFLSVHHYPFYPGGGGGDEVGEGPGRGFTRNLPLAGGAGDEVFAEAVRIGLEEIMHAFRPACWLVSAGFDAHERDPLGGMKVSEAGFEAIGRSLRDVAGRMPVIAALEGGYNLEALRASVRAFTAGVAHPATS